MSAATFSRYFGKARDAVRINSVTQMTNIIKVDNADKWDQDTKYVYADPGALKDSFDRNDYRLPEVQSNITYIFIFGKGSDSNSGDDNQFAIVTWGENSSTVSPTQGGLIFDGTADVVDALRTVAKTVKVTTYKELQIALNALPLNKTFAANTCGTDDHETARACFNIKEAGFNGDVFKTKFTTVTAKLGTAAKTFSINDSGHISSGSDVAITSASSSN